MPPWKVFVKDDDGHWYLINEDDLENFNKIMDRAYTSDDFVEFDELYARFRVDNPSKYRVIAEVRVGYGH